MNAPQKHYLKHGICNCIKYTIANYKLVKESKKGLKCFNWGFYHVHIHHYITSISLLHRLYSWCIWIEDQKLHPNYEFTCLSIRKQDALHSNVLAAVIWTIAPKTTKLSNTCWHDIKDIITILVLHVSTKTETSKSVKACSPFISKLSFT